MSNEIRHGGEEAHTLQEKIDFIDAHDREIIPLLSANEKIGLGEIASEERVDTILERFETKSYRYEKSTGDFDPGAKRLLISFSDPLDFAQQLPLIERLMGDRRCSGISIVTDNVAGVGFANFVETHSDFHLEKTEDRSGGDAEDDLVIPDIARAAEGVDIALVGIESINSPSGMMVFNAKSMFDAKKLYISNGGWAGVGGRKDLFTNTDSMDKIDGMFVNDLLAKKITETHLPEPMHDHIFATGTPVIDALEVAKGPVFESLGREKLGIKDHEVALLYCGDVSGEHDKTQYPGISSRVNEETFLKTLEVAREVARQEPEKNFVLLVRPHPRDANKEELLRPREDLPKNLRIVSAERSIVTMQEAGYAADILLSIISTENIMETLRGKESIYLGYKDEGLGHVILGQVFGETLSTIAEAPGISVIDSPDALLQKLRSAKRNPAKHIPVHEGETPPSSLDNILNVIFSE